MALDTGSPTTSVALGHGSRLLGARDAGGGRSSARLLGLVDELLATHELAPARIARILAARGPGSFTGLRVGLATALGLHQALQVPATAIGTLPVLARAAADCEDPRPIVAVVDALRGEWFAQVFTGGARPAAAGEAAIVAPERLAAWAPCRVTGFALDQLPPTLTQHDEVEILPASGLAPVLLAIANDSDLDWDPAPLVAPLYLRPPAAAQRGGSPAAP